MTTPINTFQDILDAMAQDPQLAEQLRRHVLTGELLAMPAGLESLRAAVGEHGEGLESLGDRLGQVESGLHEVKASVEDLNARTGDLGDRLGQVESGLDEVNGSVQDLNTRTGDLGATTRLLESRSGNIDGYLYEERIIQQAILRAHDLGVERARVAFAKKGLAPQQFHDTMSAAVANGSITQDEYIDLANTDLILRGTNGLHAVCEVSTGPDQDDLARALRRAAVLSRATGETVKPVVIAPAPTEEFRQQAEKRGVAVMTIAR